MNKYKEFLVEANKLVDYNLRNYAKSRINLAFKPESAASQQDTLIKLKELGLNDKKIEKLVNNKECKDDAEAEKKLQELKRIVLVQNLYSTDDKVMSKVDDEATSRN